MIYRFFKKYQPSVYIAILLLGIALFIKPVFLFQNFASFDNTANMPLFTLLLNILNGNYFVLILLGVVLIILEAYYLVRLNLNYFFIEKRTYLPALFFLLFSAVLYLKTGFHPVLISLLFLLISIDKIFSQIEKNNKLSVFFDVGLLIAVGSLFYANLLYFIIFILAGMFFLGNLTIRKLLIIIIGVLTCYFCLWFYYFFTDSSVVFFEILAQNFFHNSAPLEIHKLFMALGLYLFLLFIFSLGNLMLRLNLKRIVARKYINILIILFVFILVCYFFIPGFSIAVAYILAIPISFLLSDFFLHLRSKWFGEVFFDLLLALIIFIIIVYPL